MLVMALLAALAAPGCATFDKLDDLIDFKTFGADFDNLCVAGQVRPDSADWLNANQDAWKNHRDYSDQRQPTPLKSGDRFFNGDCSSVAKCLGVGDFECAMRALGAVADQDQ